MQCECTILSSVACSDLQYFSTLSHKRHEFRKKKNVTGHKICVLISVQLLSQTPLILRRNERDVIKKCVDLRVKYPSLLSDFN